MIALADNALSCRPPKFNVAAQAFKLGTENAYTPTAKLMFAHRYLHFVTECATENTRYAGQFSTIFFFVMNWINNIFKKILTNDNKKSNAVLKINLWANLLFLLGPNFANINFEDSFWKNTKIEKVISSPSHSL